MECNKAETKQIDRRGFLTRTARGGAAVAALAAAGALAPARAQGANERVVLGLIGAGGRGSQLIKGMTALENVETKYICDIDAGRGAVAKELEAIQGYAPTRVSDMQAVFDDKDVDAVVVATPEHWHALATVRACQAGKDVYVEKNISTTIWEGRKMLEAARKYERIVQCGTQNRSAPYAFSAREYIKNGGLGKVVRVKVFNMLPGGPWSPQPDSAPPEGLDWDAWLGPAPAVPYNPGRHRDCYSWWDYSGGVLAGDGSHQLDLARMVLGDPPQPKSCYGAGGRIAYPDNRETPDMQAITYDYGDMAMTIDNATFANYMSKSDDSVRNGDKFPDWHQNSERIEIYGTKRMMYLGRHGCGWQVFEGGGKVVDYAYGRHPDRWHQPDFIASIRSRKLPNADIEQGFLSACLVHMGNLATRLGGKHLLVDANNDRFLNCDKANALLKPAFREQYRIPDEV